MKHQSLALITALALASVANAQAWDQKFTAGTTDSDLPSGLGITSTVIAYGQPKFDPYNDPLIEDVVQVFELQGSDFVHAATLQSSLVPAGSASFGHAIALEGDLLAVGDPGAFTGGPGVGAVHIYRRGAQTWDLELVLRPTNPSPITFGYFGSVVDLHNGRLVVSAPFSCTDANNGLIEDGAVYVFEQLAGTWVETQVLTSPFPNIFSQFGRGIDLHGDRLIVGTPGSDPQQGIGGAAYIYEHDGSQFVLAATLTPSIPLQDGLYGFDVAIDATHAAVGSPAATIANFYDGRVYVYEETAQGWNEAAVLEDVGAPFQIANHFGVDLQLEGGALFVVSLMSVSVQRFEEGVNGWTSVERYTTADGFTWPRVSETRVRANGNQVLVSDFEGATLFQRTPPAKLEVNCDGTPINNGVFSFPILLDVRGEQSFAEPEMPFYIAHAVSLGTGMLFYGFNNTNIPFAAGGGQLCILPPFARAAIGGPVQYGSEVVLDLTSPPVSSGPFSFGPGTTVYMQYWARLTNGGSFLSSSLEMTFAP